MIYAHLDFTSKNWLSLGNQIKTKFSHLYSFSYLLRISEHLSQSSFKNAYYRIKSLVESVASQMGVFVCLFALLFICGAEVHLVFKRTGAYFACKTTFEFAIKITINRERYTHSLNLNIVMPIFKVWVGFWHLNLTYFAQ